MQRKYAAVVAVENCLDRANCVNKISISKTHNIIKSLRIQVISEDKNKSKGPTTDEVNKIIETNAMSLKSSTLEKSETIDKNQQHYGSKQT